MKTEETGNSKGKVYYSSNFSIDIKNIPQYEVYLNKRTKRIQIRGVLPLLKSLKKDEEKHQVVFLKKKKKKTQLLCADE